MDFIIGEKIWIVSNLRHESEVRSAIVFDINYKGNGLVTYIGDYRGCFTRSGSGAFDPEQIGKSRMIADVIKK